jgi:hypothetical protein
MSSTDFAAAEQDEERLTQVLGGGSGTDPASVVSAAKQK